MGVPQNPHIHSTTVIDELLALYSPKHQQHSISPHEISSSVRFRDSLLSRSSSMPRISNSRRKKVVRWCDDVQVGEASTLASDVMTANEKKRFWLQEREYDKINRNNNQLLEPLRNVKSPRALEIEWESYERKYNKSDHSLRGLELSQGISSGDYREKMRLMLVHAVLYTQLTGDKGNEGISTVSKALSRDALEKALVTAEKDYKMIKKDEQVRFLLQQQKQLSGPGKMSRMERMASIPKSLSRSFRMSKDKVSIYPRSNSMVTTI